MDVEKRTACNLALRIDALVSAEFPEVVPVDVVASAFASLLAAYCKGFSRLDQEEIISDTVTVALKLLNLVN